jgi:hypothetical protein
MGGQPREYVLSYGLKKKMWMMQYQYAHRSHDFQQEQLAPLTNSWREASQVSVGDWCVAYLRHRRFYAIGQVITPRKRCIHQDEVQRTLNQRCHIYLEGIVEYTDSAGAFYEDFTDDWNLPLNNPHCSNCQNRPRQRKELWRYSQRIDVKKWQYQVLEGVCMPGLSKASPHSYRAAAFPITEQFFSIVRKALEQHGGKE